MTIEKAELNVVAFTDNNYTPQQSILAALDSPSQDELLLPVHELLA